METGDYETNTLLINNISSIAYRVYEPASDLVHSFHAIAIELESSLRNEGHLVFYDSGRKGIWYFHIEEKGITAQDGTGSKALESSIHVLGYTLSVTEEGAWEPTHFQKSRTNGPQSGKHMQNASSAAAGLEGNPRPALAHVQQGAHHATSDNESTRSQRIVYENLITAILLAITTAFCPVTGAIPLNYRTVLLPTVSSTDKADRGTATESVALMGTFGAHLTTVGCLVISFNVSHCHGLLSLDNFFAASLTAHGQRVLAAPFGVHATKASSMGELGSASLAQTPNTQILSLRGYSEFNDGLWKQSCLKILQLRGIPASVLENCSWVTISIARRRLQDTKADGSRVKDGATSVSTTILWPGPLCFRHRAVDVASTNRLVDNILSGRDEYRDPLDRAGRWLESTVERGEQMSKRKAERAALPSSVDHAAQPTPMEGQPSLNVARPAPVMTGAMYPTPPDGVQPPNGITTMFDGIMSSPRNQPNATANAATLDIDDAMQDDSEMQNHNDDNDLPDAKRDRSDSNLLEDAENILIGGGDMFGDDDDITEADFNFFDEQPESSDIPMTDAGHEQLSDTPQQQVEPRVEELNMLSHLAPASLTAAQQETGVFMKPDLKDARSFQNDMHGTPVVTENSAVSLQEESTFNKLTVFGQLKASLVPPNAAASTGPAPRKRKASVFEKLEFGTVLPLINKKYERGGSFDFNPAPVYEQKKLLNTNPLPETDYLKTHGGRNRKPRDMSLSSKALMSRFTALGAPTSHPSPVRQPVSLSDDDQSSAESDQDDTSYTSEEPGSPFRSSMRRLPVDDEAASNTTSFREPEVTEEADERLALELPRLTKPDLPEMDFPKFFKHAEPLNIELSLNDDDMIQIAQLVAEQAATGTLLVDAQRVDPTMDRDGDGRRRHVDFSATIRQSLDLLRDVFPPLVGRPAPSSLKTMLAIQEMTATGHTGGMQPRLPPGREATPEHLRPNALYHMPFHHVEVRRAETKLSMLPSAINFWESLGLGPASGSKNTHAVCAFPEWAGMADSARTFLERMKGIYELLKLGAFDLMPLPGELGDGLLPYEVDKISTSPDASVTKQGSTLIESLDKVNTAIEELDVANSNIVVFMVYTSSNPGTIVESCLAFQRFFENHKRALATNHECAQNELVLQLVPADFISSPSSLVMTPASDLFKLCIEVYDRCTQFDGPMPAPGIILEPSLPRLIDFKLSSSPSASLMHENSCIYVAYAQSLDERWVAAAWTDEGGTQQATAAYCLGRKGRPLSVSMHEIAHEIWATTLELISYRKVHWRINMTKSGAMESSEIDSWSSLAKTENKANVTLILMTVDTSPSVQLLPPTPQVPLSTASMYTTPVSTPQGNVVSPEASAPTPGQGPMPGPPQDGPNPSDSEGPSALIDVTDQTWAAVLGYRLNNSTTLLELQPALMSGYLIKKTGAKLQDAPVVMEVNLIHTENTARMYDPLFREILHNFKGLGTLARARGVVDKETDVRPWHVAAAEKAVWALYMLM